MGWGHPSSKYEGQRAKERGQRAEAVVSSLLLRMGKEPWGRCF